MFFRRGGFFDGNRGKKDLSAEWANKTLLPCSVFTARVNYEEEERGRFISRPPAAIV